VIEALQRLDAGALLSIQEQLRAPFLDGLMVFFSLIGNSGLVWILMGAVLLVPKRTRPGGVFLLGCLLTAYLINDLLLKELAARARPYDALPGIELLVAPLRSYSFPSGHANSSFAAALALALAFGRRGALAYIPAALIAFSRCYVGVHYPGDVLAGMLVGTLVPLAAFPLLRRYRKQDAGR
jgi:undecaprenyl-diphosphatase